MYIMVVPGFGGGLLCSIIAAITDQYSATAKGTIKLGFKLQESRLTDSLLLLLPFNLRLSQHPRVWGPYFHWLCLYCLGMSHSRQEVHSSSPAASKLSLVGRAV